MMLDILITATRRSKLLEQTLKSFKDNMLHSIDCNVIINIDPVGVEKNNDAVKDVVEKYFANFTFFQPSKASFPKAFSTLWKWSKSDFVLNLEDDWELLQPIDIEHMIDLMFIDPSLASLRLPFKQQNPESSKNWKYFFPFNGLYYECPQHLIRSVGFCGHPSLLKGKFVNACAPLISDQYNPEKQFHNRINTKLMQEIDKWDFGVYQTADLQPAITDIGRRWMVENNFIKKGNKAFFQEWEKIKNE